MLQASGGCIWWMGSPWAHDHLLGLPAPPSNGSLRGAGYWEGGLVVTNRTGLHTCRLDQWTDSGWRPSSRQPHETSGSTWVSHTPAPPWTLWEGAGGPQEVGGH